MHKNLKEIKETYLPLLREVSSLSQLEELRIKLLGRKGILTQLIKTIPTFPVEERPRIGREINEIKREISSLIEEKERVLKRKVSREVYDLTLPALPVWRGRKHPLTQVMDEILEIFTSMGFQVFTGPEMETDYYNFEALNFPPDHPARDQQDSFQMGNGYLLRTQTSPVQIRVMEKMKPPIRMVSPGRCYRRDNPDASHFPVFHQIEGLAVDRNITFCDLKGTLEEFAHAFFGKDVRMRFLPSYFPFTEPSAEVSISCIICKGRGCPTCRRTGWLEILGAGMVHPHVFQAVDYDPQVYSGFAFGMGVERLAMLKFGIKDIRVLYENDVRVLRQF